MPKNIHRFRYDVAIFSPMMNLATLEKTPNSVSDRPSVPLLLPLPARSLRHFPPKERSHSTSFFLPRARNFPSSFSSFFGLTYGISQSAKCEKKEKRRRGRREGELANIQASDLSHSLSFLQSLCHHLSFPGCQLAR